jgi:hypothetical protein
LAWTAQTTLTMSKLLSLFSTKEETCQWATLADVRHDKVDRQTDAKKAKTNVSLLARWTMKKSLMKWIKRIQKTKNSRN